MLKTFKNLILIGFASFLLIACQQQGGGAKSKKSKTLENTQKAGFVKLLEKKLNDLLQFPSFFVFRVSSRA